MSILRRVINPTFVRNINSKLLQFPTRTTLRSFSTEDDSHDDFKPKKKAIPTGLEEVIALIDSQVKENDVMLYMKGTPSGPQCGFSSQAVRILNAIGVDFSSVNVLEYPAIRDGVKVYSEWPTVPQLYVKGEFVGGSDIMAAMFKDGDLEKLMKEKKVLTEE
jgi:monothiol glutaredoxin